MPCASPAPAGRLEVIVNGLSGPEPLVTTAAGLQAHQLHRVAAIDRCLRVQDAGGGAQRGLALLRGDGADGTQGLTRFDGNGLAVDEQSSKGECHGRSSFRVRR
jgi:hypothetical protein